MAMQIDYSQHTPYSDPGAFAGLVAGVPVDPEGLSAIARNVIVHYRASGHQLPVETRGEINSRWLSAVLAADQSRHPWPLERERQVTDRVQGCCRDHTLFCVGALREHGIPARSRVGFAGYFVGGWHHDHVVVEAWLDDRWRRFDPEIDAPRPGLPAPMDMTDGVGFVTAAQAWSRHRRGEIDAETYGVDATVPVFRGARFLFDEVIYEVAHRYGDELLLWDAWGRIGPPDEPVDAAEATWMDGVAALLLAADHGDEAAERELLAWYRSDDRLHPGDVIEQHSPFGDPPVTVTLPRRP